MSPRLLPGEPAEWIVVDDEEPCPYLPGRTARLPMRLPVRSLAPAETDERLLRGDRRHGFFLYTPSCAECSACEPIRVVVPDFELVGWQRRALRKGDAAFRVEIGPPEVSADRLALYERHRRERDLAQPGSSRISPRAYRSFLVDACVDAYELRLLHADRLAAVCVVDRGADALSAVYCYWDPALSRLSPGTYAILRQLALCRSWGLRYLYLGLYVEQNAHMRYKARFLPHERRIDGAWRQFSRTV